MCWQGIYRDIEVERKGEFISTSEKICKGCRTFIDKFCIDCVYGIVGNIFAFYHCQFCEDGSNWKCKYKCWEKGFTCMYTTKFGEKC